jgi:restriction endonuclease Mrr
VPQNREGAHEGIFITTSSFTDGAKKAATSSLSPIKLMEREDVFAFLEIDAVSAN